MDKVLEAAIIEAESLDDATLIETATEWLDAVNSIEFADQPDEIVTLFDALGLGLASVLSTRGQIDLVRAMVDAHESYAGSYA